MVASAQTGFSARYLGTLNRARLAEHKYFRRSQADRVSACSAQCIAAAAELAVVKPDRYTGIELLIAH
jgi:hypothetical protein